MFFFFFSVIIIITIINVDNNVNIFNNVNILIFFWKCDAFLPGFSDEQKILNLKHPC